MPQTARQRMRSGLVGLAALIASLALCGCQLFAPGSRAPEVVKPATPPAPQEVCAVLALPKTGPYAPIAAKISRGASQSAKEANAQGRKFRLEMLDSENPAWLASLDALPAHCAVVGGPLQAKSYAAARTSGSIDRRAFFTFLPSLDQGDEGVRAWRFFPSPQDQIDALVGFATGQLNIRSYGAFYPTDAYAARMTGLLEQSLASQNMLLTKATYDPANATTWSEAVATIIKPTVAQGSTTPVPQTPFEAIFLPDSWKNMEMLTTSLAYNGEDRLVMLGTSLWEQGLSGRLLNNADKFALAVFPVAWNATTPPKALQGPGNDFWVALGYDFVRFAAGMALPARADASAVTAAAARASSALVALAPMSYDTAGVAHARLNMFQAAPTGMVPVDTETFLQTRTAILQRAALRMQGLPNVDAQGNPLVPGTLPQMQPGTAPQPILGSTPRPSYKLRLPTQR